MKRIILLIMPVVLGTLFVVIISSVFAYNVETLTHAGEMAAPQGTNVTTTVLKAVNRAEIQSDDFNSCALDTGIWTYFDPLNDATPAMNYHEVSISLPPATTHDTWGAPGVITRTVPRIMQQTDDTDFGIKVKYDTQFSNTLSSGQFQMQGVMIEQSDKDLLRLEFLNRDTGVRLFVASFVNGDPSVEINVPIFITETKYMRVTRVGDLWTVAYSADDANWNSESFMHNMTVKKAGAYAGNADVPVNVVIDYFYNIAAEGPGDENGPTLEVLVDGEGMVTEDPDKAVYQCNEDVELTADPGTDWQFDSWSGDLASAANPINVTMDNTKVVTATFVRTNFPVYLPIVLTN